MTDKEHIGFRQGVRLVIRGLRIYAAFPKPALLAKLLQTTVNAVTPLMNIYFSALILNELTGGRSRERLVYLAVLITLINLAVMLVRAAINQWAWFCYWEIWRVPYDTWNAKLNTMDYIDLEDPDMQAAYAKLRGDSDSLGFGLPSLFRTYDVIIGGVIQIALSAMMGFSLFTLPTPDGSAYAWLDSFPASCIVLGALSLSVFLPPYLSSLGGKAWAKSSEEGEKHNRMLGYYFFGIGARIRSGMDIRIYDQKRLTDVLMSFLQTNHYTKHGVKAGRLYALSAALTHLCNGVVYLFAALKAFAGAFGVGSIVQFVGAITQFGGGFASVLSGFGTMANNNVFLAELFRFLDTPNRKRQGTRPVTQRDDGAYEIEFQNVSFKYPSSDEFALQNVSFRFQSGKRVAVVGMNGSGKTTMIKLLCRLYDPDEGVITLNGVDIKEYDYEEYMALFSVVFQDFKLLPFTLGQNVAAKLHYDAAKAAEVLEKAGFGRRLAQMPKGLDTYLYKNFDENGVEVSGGEEQKIALARALYKDAPFVVLDEPTAALDPVAEYEIYAKFNELVDGKTAVYISHRLSSCRFCDDIAVFHEGKLLQRGSHKVLLADEAGMYFSLWSAQAQYYNQPAYSISI